MFVNIFKKLKENPMSLIISLFAAFGGFLYGYDTGTISGILDMDCFKQTFGRNGTNGIYEIESNDKSLIVSILSAGTFVGALLGYPSSDYLGRRWGLILACIIFSIGVAFQTGGTTIALFVIGRFIAGLGVGIISCIVPMYQSECSPKWIRGGVVSVYQWFITIGLLVASIVNDLTKNQSSYACYRIPIGIQLIWSLILGVGMFILPESPRYLVSKNRIEQAYKSQSRLLSCPVDDPQVENTINEFIKDHQLMETLGKTSYFDCFKMGPQKNLQRTLVGIFLQAFQQLSGINFIFYYGTTFFTSSGLANPFLITIIINIVNVIMTIPGILLMDKLGRRYILIFGAIGMLVSEYIIAIVGTIVGQSNENAQKTLIAFVCLYIAFFASTWGPAPWVVIGELYPISIRAKCMSLSSASNWLFNFALGYATPYMVDKDKANLGSKVFFIWGTTCVGCLLFAFFSIWETKGLSLEQINYLVTNSSPIRSNQLNKQLKSGSIIDDMNHRQSTDFSKKNSADSFELPSISQKINNNYISNDVERL